ncbi:MAG TPA: response regulator, partial [Allosphingosinicella sp.]|nr:response regulator [Allosphingosinicella sp.]
PIGEYTGLKVSDTGTGIPSHIIGKIFEPFFTTKEVGKGTGLGLSTVYGIVKQSGGFIFADSVLRKGTTFTIYLPVHRAPQGEAEAKSKVKEKAGELWGTGTILLVEDEAMVRAVAERALTRHGYTVLTAENGEEALEILGREEKIDLMISDVVMPSMDGPTTVRAARKSQPNLPILFISGYAEEQLRKSIDIPNVSFLAKPFSVQSLAETVRGVLAAK